MTLGGWAFSYERGTPVNVSLPELLQEGDVAAADGEGGRIRVWTASILVVHLSGELIYMCLDG